MLCQIKKKENVRSAPCNNANGCKAIPKAEAGTLIKRTFIRVGRFEKMTSKKYIHNNSKSCFKFTADYNEPTMVSAATITICISSFYL